jgi:hypothetical protein
MTEREKLPQGSKPAGDHPARPGGQSQHLQDVPLLGDLAPGVLQVA